MKKTLTIILMMFTFLFSFDQKTCFALADTSPELKIEEELEEQIISDYFINKDGFGEVIYFITSYDKSNYICLLNISQDKYYCQLTK